MPGIAGVGDRPARVTPRGPLAMGGAPGVLGAPGVTVRGAGEGGAGAERQDGHNAYSIIEWNIMHFVGISLVARLACTLLARRTCDAGWVCEMRENPGARADTLGCAQSGHATRTGSCVG